MFLDLILIDSLIFANTVRYCISNFLSSNRIWRILWCGCKKVFTVESCTRVQHKERVALECCQLFLSLHGRRVLPMYDYIALYMLYSSRLESKKKEKIQKFRICLYIYIYIYIVIYVVGNLSVSSASLWTTFFHLFKDHVLFNENIIKIRVSTVTAACSQPSPH